VAHFALCGRDSASGAEVCQPAASRFVGHAPLTYCYQ
jgi:hypothetical protein